LIEGFAFVNEETIDFSVFVSSSFIVCQNVIVVVAACGVPESVRAVADGTMSMAAMAVAASADNTARREMERIGVSSLWERAADVEPRLKECFRNM
jgi:hypothetical protein